MAIWGIYKWWAIAANNQLVLIQIAIMIFLNKILLLLFGAAIYFHLVVCQNISESESDDSLAAYELIFVHAVSDKFYHVFVEFLHFIFLCELKKKN